MRTHRTGAEMPFTPDQPYNDLPFLPPSAQIETVITLKHAITASRAVAELKGAGERIPNQNLLIRAIVLQEARLSSEIENIVTTNDDLYRALSEEDSKWNPQVKEVMWYQYALWHGYSELQRRPLSPSLFVEIASNIRQHDTGLRTMPGTRIANQRGEIIYTPPSGKDQILALLNNLCDFIHADDGLDPLIKLAVIHYQFEAIHPFSDGNGRTGRILNVLYLVQAGLLTLPVLYLSGYIIGSKSEYYRGLRMVTEEAAWEAWVVYILTAIETTAKDTCKRIDDIRKLMDHTLEHIRQHHPKLPANELVDLIFQQPYTRISMLAEAGIAHRQTASEYLNKLESIGVLTGTRVGKDKLFVNTPLFDVLIRPLANRE